MNICYNLHILKEDSRETDMVVFSVYGHRIAHYLILFKKNNGNGSGSQGLWSNKLADSYAVRAARAMLKLAQTQNRIIDLSMAKVALIDATRDDRNEIQTLAGQVLAYLSSPDAQRSVAQMALNQANPKAVRISAFESLAVSAKFNANLLENEMIDAIYSLVSSKEPKTIKFT